MKQLDADTIKFIAEFVRRRAESLADTADCWMAQRNIQGAQECNVGSDQLNTLAQDLETLAKNPPTLKEIKHEGSKY